MDACKDSSQTNYRQERNLIPKRSLIDLNRTQSIYHYMRTALISHRLTAAQVIIRCPENTLISTVHACEAIILCADDASTQENAKQNIVNNF